MEHSILRNGHTLTPPSSSPEIDNPAVVPYLPSDTTPELAFYAPIIPTASIPDGERQIARLPEFGVDRLQTSTLFWTLTMRVKPAVATVEALNREVTAFRSLEIELADVELKLEADHAAVEENLKQATLAVAQAIGEAHLPFPVEGGIRGPETIEEIVQRTALGPVEEAGFHHIAPAQHLTGGNIWLLLLGGLTSLLVGICLATLIGFFRISDLTRGNLVSLSWVFATGVATVASMSMLVGAATKCLARAFLCSRLPASQHDDVSWHDTPPQPGGKAVAVAFIGLCCVLWCGEIAAEVFGFQMLSEMRRNLIGTVGLLNPGIWGFALIGVVISGPLLGAKASKTWQEQREAITDAWLRYRVQMRLLSLRQNPAYSRCLQAAVQVQDCERQLSRIGAEIERVRAKRTDLANLELPEGLRSRLERAWGIATGETQKLHIAFEKAVSSATLKPDEPRGTLSHVRPVKEEI